MKKPCQHAYINVQTKGDLSSLSWIESALKHYTDHDQKQLCHVHYAALNFRDVMLATGRLPADAIPGDLATQDCILGMEVSGLDEMGKRVMGLVPAKVSLIYNFSVVCFIHNCISIHFLINLFPIKSLLYRSKNTGLLFPDEHF